MGGATFSRLTTNLFADPPTIMVEYDETAKKKAAAFAVTGRACLPLRPTGGTAVRTACHSSRTTNPNPKVRKSGEVVKAVLASMVLEEGPIRAARGDSRDIRKKKERKK